MPNNGMLLSHELHQMLTLTLAERLEVRDLKSCGPITRAKREEIRRSSMKDAERAIAEALETLATLDRIPHANPRSLAELIAAVK